MRPLGTALGGAPRNSHPNDTRRGLRWRAGVRESRVRGAPRAGTKMLRAEVNGFSVAYERTGDGPALVLLHGFTHDSRVWRQQLEALADQFTVIAWDAPGAGQSSDPPETFGIVDWADCLAGFLDAAGVYHADIIGLSWGGPGPGVLSAPRRAGAVIGPGRYVRRLEGLASRTGPRGAPGGLLARCVAAEFVPRYLPGMFGKSPPQEARDELARIMTDFHPVGFRLMATALAYADTRDLLPKIHVPTLLVWGDADVRSPMTVAHQMRDAIPGARLSVIAGAGHVSNLEEPAQFNAEVREFCSSVSIQGSRR